MRTVRVFVLSVDFRIARLESLASMLWGYINIMEVRLSSRTIRGRIQSKKRVSARSERDRPSSDELEWGEMCTLSKKRQCRFWVQFDFMVVFTRKLEVITSGRF